jgi:radical SAM superfamily enzyme YgiQ (UPF0313 family)
MKSNILLVHLPLRTSYVAPLNLALLKSSVQPYGVDVLCLDLSLKYNRKVQELLKLKESLIRSSRAERSTDWIKKIMLCSSAYHQSLWKRFVLKKDFPRAYVNYSYLFDLLDERMGELKKVDRKMLSLISQMKKEILKYNPITVGFSVSALNIAISLNVARELKKASKDIKIIFGGPVTLFAWKTLLENYEFIDYCVVGEGEEAFPLLIDSLARGKRRLIKNVAYRKNKEVLLHPANYLDINKIPFPNYDDFDLRKYKKIGIETHRGCVHRCAFCTNRKTPGNQIYREKSAERVLDEIKFLRDKYGKNDFHFCDNLSNANPRRIKKICKGLVNESITWESQFFPRIDREMAFLLSKSGCRFLWLGIESMSTKVLRGMNKFVTKEEIIKTLKNLKEAGVNSHLMLFFGFPTEGFLDIIKTALNTFRYRKYICSAYFGFFILCLDSIVHLNPGRYGIKIEGGEPLRKWEMIYGVTPYSTEGGFIKNTISLPLVRILNRIFCKIRAPRY